MAKKSRRPASIIDGFVALAVPSDRVIGQKQGNQDLLWPGDTPPERQAFKNAIAAAARKEKTRIGKEANSRKGDRRARQYAKQIEALRAKPEYANLTRASLIYLVRLNELRKKGKTMSARQITRYLERRGVK